MDRTLCYVNKEYNLGILKGIILFLICLQSFQRKMVYAFFLVMTSFNYFFFSTKNVKDHSILLDKAAFV